MIASLLHVFGHFSVNTLVATYVTYLGAAPVVMVFLTGMFFAISLAIRPVSGPTITKVDKRTLMIAVFALGGFVNLGYALFHSIPAFIFFRFFNGVQYSFVGSLLMTSAADSLPKEKLASGMGIYGIGGAVGTALGPSLSYGLYQLGTRTGGEDRGFTFVFLFAAIVFLLAIIPSAIMLPDNKTKEQVASTGAWYKNIFTVHAVPMTIVIMFIIMGYAILNSYVFNYGQEQGIGNISLFYTVMACTLVVSRPLSGYLSDRFGAPKIIIPGLILFALSFQIFGAGKSIETVLIAGFLAALGIGSTHPTIQAMCIQSETPLRRSVASNTLYVGLDLGLFIGPFLGGVVYGYSNYATVFKLTSIPILLALAAFIIILPIYNRRLKELEKLEETSG
jgi:MFS family permease